MEDLLGLLTNNGAIELWALALVVAGLFLAGFVDSIAGGGGLISIPVFMIAGLPIHSVIATNKLSMSMGTAVATAKYLREGFMRWRLIAPCLVCALVGSSAGATCSLLASGTMLRVLMLVVIPVAGFYVLRTKNMDDAKPAWPPAREALTCAAIALGVGFYDGLYGPGTGTFLMLLLTGLGHLRLTDAAGTTKAINLTTNVCALVVFLVNGAVMVPLGLLAGAFNIAGNYLGASLFTKKGAGIARPLILAVLVVFAVRVVCELAGVV